uniref:Uncharacterized protein n=1 Tax=Romanomermis culicivorax TaxID=13658 RepID=A0A915JZU8_ROMCU
MLNATPSLILTSTYHDEQLDRSKNQHTTATITNFGENSLHVFATVHFLHVGVRVNITLGQKIRVDLFHFVDATRVGDYADDML